MKKLFRTLLKIVTMGVAVSLTQYAFADSWPKRPITLIVPYKAGGGTDAYARAISAAAKDVLGVPVAVVNKPGSSGMNGANAVLNARPDGYTFLLTSGGSFLLTTLIRDGVNIDAMNSFDFVSQVGHVKTSLMVPMDSPFKTIEDLLETAQTKNLRWGHTGRGGFHHVAGMGFLEKNNVSAQDVPFKGGGPTRAALIGNQVDFGFLGVQQSKGFEQQLRVLAVNSDTRDAVMNNIPSFGELGVAFTAVSSPTIVLAPKGTPQDIISKMEQALGKITQSPKFAEILAERGAGPVYKDANGAKKTLANMKQDVMPLVEDLKQ